MANFQDGWVLSGTPPSFDPDDDPTAFNPFGPSGAEPSFQYVTPRDLIDSARTRHWAFSSINFGDGAALLFLNQRQRELLAAAGSDIEGIVGTAVQYAVSPNGISGQVVSFTGGVPILAATGVNGWVVHEDEDGVPFVDGTEPMIAADPLGDQQGFPLPAEMVRLINVVLVYNTNNFIPVDLVNERARLNAMPGRNPLCFVAGNRLIPMRGLTPNSQNSADRWASVSGIQLSYVAIDTLRTLDDAVTLPVVLVGAMIAETAHFFAMQSKEVTIAERTQFRDEADRAGAMFREASLNLLASPMDGQVDYRG